MLVDVVARHRSLADRVSLPSRPLQCDPVKSSLILFGSPHLARSDNLFELPATAPSGLLTVLALAGGWMARDQLSLLFWPDSGTADAQRQLRVTLHRSRQWLASAGHEEALQTERQRARLLMPSDVAGFREAIARGDWPAALALQRAPLLEGHAVRGFAQLDEWISHQRDALRADWRRAARAHADALERAGDAGGAFILLRSQLQDDLLAEDTLQALLRVAPAAGERVAALTLFERFRGRAADALGLAPMPQTMALVEGLRRVDAAPAVAFAHDPPPPTVAWPEVLCRPPLLGRESALAELNARSVGLTVVEGEPGIGKTRLVHAALQREPQGTAALWIAARDLLQSAPLQALITALADRLDTLAGLDLSSPQRLEWARLLPAVAGSERMPPPEPQATGLRAAAVALLQRWPGPVVIDDLQWLDADTVGVLAAAMPGAGRRWLATLRPSEPGAAVRDWLSTLEVDGWLHSISLAPMPPEALEELAARTIGHRLPRFNSWLVARSGGNPFFALESLRALHEEGRFDASRAGWAQSLEALADGAAAVPPRAAGLVRRRLQRLDEATLRVLRVASVAGDAEALEPLAELAGLSAWAAAAGLAQAQAAGLLAGRRFAHDLVRQVLSDDTPEPMQVLWHAGIARRLADRLPPHVVAAHWWAANEPAQALDATLEAARLDSERGLLDAAERLLSAASERLGDTASPALDVGRIAVARAVLARRRLDLDAAESWAVRALQSMPMPATRQAALVERFEVAMLRGRLNEAADWLAQARDIDPELPTLWLDGANLAYARGDAAECAALTGRYVSWLRRRPPGVELSGALTSQGVALDVAGQHAAAAPLHEEALAIARRLGARATELEAAGNWLFCLGEMGRDAEAARVGLQTLARDSEVFNATLAANLAYSLLALGRLGEAEHWYRRVLASDNTSAACAASGKLLEIAARRGADDAGLRDAVATVFAAIAGTEMYGVQAGALVAVLNHGLPDSVEQARACLKHEPLYPGLQQRLDAALARHGLQASPR